MDSIHKKHPEFHLPDLKIEQPREKVSEVPEVLDWKDAIDQCGGWGLSLNLLGAIENDDPVANEMWPLRWAIIKDYPVVVKSLLVLDEIDPTYNDYYVLRMALDYKRSEIARMILESIILRKKEKRKKEKE